MRDRTEKYSELKITGKSTLYNEDEIIEMIYELLSDKAEFQIQ